RSTIYSRVILIIGLMTLFLFISFGLIYRSVHENQLNEVIMQSGNNVGSIVEGAMYHSMLENNKSELYNIIDVINTLPSIDEVNLYDGENYLVYGSFSLYDDLSNPDCIECHDDMNSLFPRAEKAYHIIDEHSKCKSTTFDKHRQLLIRTPILNEPSCSTTECHAHDPEEDILGSLIIKVPLKQLDTAVQQSSIDFYVMAIISSVILLGLLILLTTQKIKKPLNALLKASKAVASGQFNTRINIGNDQLDDMRLVAVTFNDMLDNLQQATVELENWSQQLEYKVRKKTEELRSAQSELIQLERIASLGKLSASVAHELNNPLSGILIYTKLITKQLGNVELYASKKESMLKHLSLIESETKRCGDIVRGMLDFSKKEQDNMVVLHLHQILSETFDLMSHPVKIAGISFITNFTATKDLVKCGANQIKQACVAVIMNASEAVSENGEIILSTSNPDDQTISIEISDNGAGITEEVLPHIFEPFYTTKHGVSGIGLGLAIVHGIVQRHNGKIEVASEPGKGTTISIILPLSEEKT
ncbi:MAG: HAMP domain-containing protein, partial [Bacteroidetes bacterium]|nr:HAMP domain-containing protein [Bacteroidota bacterium]